MKTLLQVVIVFTGTHRYNRSWSPRQERFFDFISQTTNKVKQSEDNKDVVDIFI